MTCFDKFKEAHPDALIIDVATRTCPHTYGIMNKPDNCCMEQTPGKDTITCRDCWNREMPEPADGPALHVFDPATGKETTYYPNEPHILDSGARHEFETGAVRDIREGKGRCDLLPLDVVCECFSNFEELNKVLWSIGLFQEEGESVSLLYQALYYFTRVHYNNDVPTMLLEVSKHFEEGCLKYGDNNWRKGIPVRCYIDSAVRHYIKLWRGDKDEPHDRAFCWNILCAIWTCKHKPELNDYAKKDEAV